MHVLALDFDGVICDSSREVFVVAADTYAAVEPRSALLDTLRPLREDAVSGGDQFRNHEIYHRFLNLLPLGNRAEDFGVSLRAIESGTTITDQKAYDGFFQRVGGKWLEGFHRSFYGCRDSLRETDVSAWLRLHLPFPGFSETLKRHSNRTKPAVATAKDKRSVHLLLGELGFESVFDPELILDKETGVEKTQHLRALRERTRAEYHEITFVDDKVNHLVRVAELGVRPVLAGWGFNTNREHELAHELGFEVANLDTADEVLFKGE